MIWASVLYGEPDQNGSYCCFMLLRLRLTRKRWARHVRPVLELPVVLRALHG